jgi:uncharacterized protein (DUF1800 family)
MKTRAAFLLAFVLVAALSAQGPDDQADNSGDKAIVHLLNRMGYGPRPGDVERVQAMGIQKYIDLQLHPERIDDSAMDGWLSGLATVHMSSREISEQFEQPQIEARRLRQQQAAQNPPSGQHPQGLPPDPSMMTPGQRAAARAALPPLRPAQNPFVELQEQKLLRDIYSERQLQEVLADFWFNHFNVDANKGRVRFLLTEYERESVRPHVLGRFRDLLEATAKSPAMLFYLDNFQSVDPDAAKNRGKSARPSLQVGRRRFGLPVPQPPPPALPANAPRGLNENYARELMELHTLGVDGGYTQKDVTEVARAFTGWTIDNPRLGGGFEFNERLHDNRDKTILGHKINAGGIKDGEEVLDILASHPSTARFISTKLARRFVSDTPPPALVDRMAMRFTDTKGDLREVMRTLLTSPEFQSAYRAKVKTPLDFVVSALRATGASIVTARPLINALQQLGMPLYQCQPPTGYKDTAETWTNTGALVTRMNFAANLASNRQLGMNPREIQAIGTSDLMIDSVLHGDASDTTRSTVARAQTATQMLALTLGSPEFQRR